jgi:hypothetical protein
LHTHRALIEQHSRHTFELPKQGETLWGERCARTIIISGALQEALAAFARHRSLLRRLNYRSHLDTTIQRKVANNPSSATTLTTSHIMKISLMVCALLAKRADEK